MRESSWDTWVVLVPLFSRIVMEFNLRPNTITCLVMMGVREKRRLSQHKGTL